MLKFASYIVAASLGLATFALDVHAQTATTPNWCKGRAQGDCNASVACSWRETITDGVSKTSCIYNAKAAKAMVEKMVNAH